MNTDSYYLGELLAVLHGDGGHYQDEHGTEKSVEDAITKYYNLRARIEELTDELCKCGDELDKYKPSFMTIPDW